MSEIQHSRRGIPLASLRCFESFSRLGDVAAAAVELGITPSAVSHQLDALEKRLKMTLTERRGRRLALNADGRSYFEAVSPAFALLDIATAQLQNRRLPQRLVVSALPLVATGWLLPQLASFRARHPNLEIHVQYVRFQNYTSDAADVSLRFGHGDWPGYASEKLMDGVAVPVCSPALLRSHGPFDEATHVLAAPLIHDGTVDTWAAWAKARGVVPAEPLKGMICEDGMLAKSAAAAGIGIALMRPLLIGPELAAGTLVVAHPAGLRDGRDYYLCTRDDRDIPLGVRQLIAWLAQAASQTGARV